MQSSVPRSKEADVILVNNVENGKRQQREDRQSRSNPQTVVAQR